METKTSRIMRVYADHYDLVDDCVAAEAPLEIILRLLRKKNYSRRPLTVTMRTPGDDTHLAMGFLLSEAIIESPQQVCKVEVNKNEIILSIDSSVRISDSKLSRNYISTSSCGVCGKAELRALGLDEIQQMPDGTIEMDKAVFYKLRDCLLDAQTAFNQTGGLHACALYSTEGELIDIREDIGRHNAFDKLIGANWEKVDLGQTMVLLSGRVSYEMIQKSLRAGIPIVCALGAPSSMAVEIASYYNQTLLGFLKHDKFNVYSGPHRISGLRDENVSK